MTKSKRADHQQHRVAARATDDVVNQVVDRPAVAVTRLRHVLRPQAGKPTEQLVARASQRLEVVHHLTCSLSLSAPGAFEEAEHRGGVEVEHLRTGELSLTRLIETQDRAVEAFSRGAQSPLPPQHDHLPLVVRGHDAWVHPPLRLGRLQRVPGRAPATRPGLDLRATTRAAVGERWRPMKLYLRVVEIAQPLLIPLLHRLE